MNRFAMVASIAFLGLGTSELSGSEPGHDELTRYPTYGAALKAPKGWVEQTRDKGKTIVRWISPDSAPAGPNAMIMIEWKGLEAQNNLKVPIEWRTLGDHDTRFVSHGIEIETPQNVGGPRRINLMWWALVKIDDGRLVLVNFTQPIDAPPGGSTYNDLGDLIVISIRPGVGGDRPRRR
jgi:hypothetical protein